MSIYSELFQKICREVYPAYKTIYSNHPIQTHGGDPDSAKIHSHLLLLIEIIIYEYRKKHATTFEPLKGDKALKHILFTKYNVSIPDLDLMTLEQIVFALLKELSPENLPLSAQNYVNGIKLNQKAAGIDWSLDVNWILGSGESTLGQLDVKPENQIDL
ncbi:TPA: hypothetical protein ACHV8K_003646 [Providencia stuartii]